MSQVEAKAKLRAQLVADNVYFKEAINLVPASMFFDTDALDKIQSKKTAPAVKRGGVQLSEKATKKRKKFDPNERRFVTDLVGTVDESDGSEDDESPAKVNETPEDVKEKIKLKLEAMKAKRNALGKEDNQKRRRMRRQMNKVKRRLKQPTGNTAKKVKTPPTQSAKPVFNSEGKMVFSKFDFSAGGSGGARMKTDLPTGKNYSKLLEKAEARTAQLDKLKVTDVAAAQLAAEKQQWKAALGRAEGVKVKDDAELLKRSVARKKRKKDRSTRDWDAREQRVEQKLNERQQKRTKNVKKKSDARTEKKMKKAKARGRIIPGF